MLSRFYPFRDNLLVQESLALKRSNQTSFLNIREIRVFCGAEPLSKKCYMKDYTLVTQGPLDP